MKCYVCSEQQWYKLVGVHSQSLIQVCKACGNLCHEVDPAQESTIRDYYRTKYKPVLGTPAIITAKNKLQYISKFLVSYLKDKKGLLCADIGAATGYVLNYLRQRGHRVTGSEWVVANRRLCEHLYGIPLTEELSDKNSYDFLSMYHVLEHLVEPDVKLRKYAGMLSEGGRFMISTPRWLGMLQEESGTPMRGGGVRSTAQGAFDELFHKNHINLFTTRSLRNLFNRCGMTVVQEDMESYGQTYLLRRGDVKPIEPEDWQAVTEKVLTQKRAMGLYFDGKFQEAVKVWPPFPEAWVGFIFGVYGKDPERQADMMAEMNGEVRASWRFMVAEAQWLARQERLDEALRLADRVLQGRFMADVLYFMGEVLMRKGDYRAAMDTFHRVSQLQPHRWQDCFNWIIHCATKMPSWDERAREELTRAVVQQAEASGAASIQEPGPVGPPQEASVG